jgi:site-specific recombinase XerD
MSLNTNINLDKPASDKETLILHSITTGRVRFRINSGHRIHPNNFDKDTQRVKKKVPDADKLNALLEQQQAQIKQACRILEFTNKPVTKDNVVASLPFVIKSNPTAITLEVVFSEWINSAKKRVAVSTVGFYNTILKHLLAFNVKTGYQLTFERMDLSFYEAFTTYLYEDVKCFDNYCGKVIKNLKTFLYWARDKNFHSSTAFEKWRIMEENDKEPVCLLQEELKTLKEFQPPTETLSKVKDLFLLQCYTGLRFSDMQNLRKENIIGQTITITTLKTRQKISIPIMAQTQDILNKYFDNGKNIIPVISNQKMNDYLKELFLKAELKRKVQKIRLRGSYREQETFELHEVISSHAGRHTFATISLMIGIDAETVKAITGHKKHETFKRYLHLTDKFKAEKMQLWENI